jgi:hypothetical protein
VTRFALVALGVVIGLGVLSVATARFFGKSGSRLSVLVSVVASWLGAYVLWSFASSLAARYGVMAADEPAWFALFALAGGWWHYRVRVSAGRDRALVVFVGAQLVWLVVLLYRNGVLTP